MDRWAGQFMRSNELKDDDPHSPSLLCDTFVTLKTTFASGEELRAVTTDGSGEGLLAVMLCCLRSGKETSAQQVSEEVTNRKYVSDTCSSDCLSADNITVSNINSLLSTYVTQYLRITFVGST
eukprot:12105823-Ditylum_brightwellii.AAC.1